MFDASFIELVLVAVVALVVLGPERLPGAVKTAGLWIGRLKRSFNNIKKDIEKEIGADDIRRQLRNEEIMSKFDHTKSQFTKTIDSVKSQTDAVKKDLDIKEQFSAVAGLGKGETSSAPKKETSSSPSKETSSSSNKETSSSSDKETSTLAKDKTDTPSTPTAKISKSLNTEKTAPTNKPSSKSNSESNTDNKTTEQK